MGALFLVYLVLYSIGRLVITLWSAYKIVALGFNQAQWISLVGLAVGIPALIYLLRRRQPVQPAVSCGMTTRKRIRHGRQQIRNEWLNGGRDGTQCATR